VTQVLSLLQLAKTVRHGSSPKVGRDRPYRFRLKPLQKALDAGPVPDLLNHASGRSPVTNEHVYLQDLMLTPLQEYPTENLYRVLGIVPSCDPTLSAAHRIPLTSMVLDFLEGCLRALMGGASAALEKLGPTDACASELLNQVRMKVFIPCICDKNVVLR
jgi:hypothetical protein